MTVPEVRPLTRMRDITTVVMVGTVAVVGGLVLVIGSGAWWHVALVAPGLLLAAWVASLWHTRPSRSVLVFGLGFAEVTWAIGVLVGADIAAAVPIGVIGAVAVATSEGSRLPRATALLAMIGATALLSLINAPEATVGYVVGSVLYGLLFVATFWINDITWRLFAELDAMRKSDSELAVVKERMRFAADLHDIQGHTLHVIKLKAAVAARLQHTDPEHVAAELAEIERLTGETIDQAQQLVNSTRKLSFRSELVNATALMTAAGIQVDVSGGDTRLAVNEELFALVLREGTTNILRHPVARTVAITIAADALTISNDGATGTVGPERGLAALRERIAQSGGVLEVSHEADAFTLSLAVRREAA